MLLRDSKTWQAFLAAAMSWAQGKCTFGPRLSDEEIEQLSQYVAEQAAADWK